MKRTLEFEGELKQRLEKAIEKRYNSLNTSGVAMILATEEMKEQITKEEGEYVANGVIGVQVPKVLAVITHEIFGENSYIALAQAMNHINKLEEEKEEEE